ncbi:hypothetical protein AS850_02690 [Frondihabitans sp. 762G35]|uniref:hypothetical protein n=1 Tax=Frondihabitans sp. 762G35 TaxID=1446794 RepID=UPI000D1FE957|nr:hypothetical protein [Frondihabitans sp. 762G35]ARC55980.1 hypothetical protein AS850_02690 [Frondihabitans sp. 762G35]
MAKTKVVMNQAEFGRQVMSSAAMEAQLRPLAERVASQLPNATVVAVRTTARGGGSRVRLRVETPHTYENQTRQRLINALRSVIGQATPRE